MRIALFGYAAPIRRSKRQARLDAHHGRPRSPDLIVNDFDLNAGILQMIKIALAGDGGSRRHEANI